MTRGNREEIAEHLYTIYCRAVGGKAFNGDPLPKWKQFRADKTKLKQSDGWLAVAEVVQCAFVLQAVIPLLPKND